MKSPEIQSLEFQFTMTNSKCWWGWGETLTFGFLEGMHNYAATLDKTPLISYKTKYVCALGPTVSLLVFLQEK